MGAHGPSKCLVGAFAALTDRVAELERCVAKSEDDLRDHEALAVKRREALLATIATLEERIDRLEELRGSDSRISGAAACSSPLVIHDEGKEDVESFAKAAHGLSGGQDTDIVSERSHAANGMPTCDNDAFRAPVPTFADKAAAPPQAALDNDNSGFVEVGKRRKPRKKGDKYLSRHGALSQDAQLLRRLELLPWV